MVNVFAAKDNRIRFIAMLESGEMVDEDAEVVQTQVVANKSRASDRTRLAVPIYHQMREKQPPVWQESAHIETGYAKKPTNDTQWCRMSGDAEDLVQGIRKGAVEVSENNPLMSHGMAGGAVAASVLVFLLCVLAVRLTAGSAEVVDAAQTEVVSESERVSHELTDSLGDATTEVAEDAADAGGDRRADTGGSAQKSVEAGELGDSEEGDAAGVPGTSVGIR